MFKVKQSLLITLCVIALLLSHQPPTRSQASDPEVLVLTPNNVPLDHLTDGDSIRLRLTLPQNAEQSIVVNFSLAGLPVVLRVCTVERGQDRCQTEPFAALGWRWDPGGVPVEARTIEARAGGDLLAASSPIPVSARPVVMVHGFISDWNAWQNYLGPGGYLASIGVQGFAVGDGQVEGAMNTGRLDQPTARTNTIAENAAILSEYIDNVKKLTGAQKVDLVGHSMGGLISRYYIDRLMRNDEAAQLIMLGSPMAGTNCGNLPASLGYYLPASLEIRPNYVADIFNAQIDHRHGVPFYALAGTSILEAIKSPCTPVPSDLAVSQGSVGAIPLHSFQLPVLHMELNNSSRVFEEYVKPLLQTLPGKYTYEPDPPLQPTHTEQQQFTRAFTGHLDPGASQDLTIHIDPDVAVAGFALFDTTRSLDVTVHGANGNVIALDPDRNGLTIIDDPKALFQLGYGFNNPKPGAWLVNLATTDKTPASGADYALTASFQGGARLLAQTSTLIPRLEEPVQLTASLDKAGQPLEILDAQANIRSPDGSLETLPLVANAGAARQATWTPHEAGLYSVEIDVTGRTADGLEVDRAAFFTVEAQPAPRSPWLTLGALCAVLLIVLAGSLWVVATWIKRNRRRKGIHAN